MYQDDDGLFGRDWRHKPPRADLLTIGHGWGGSHGRLAYSSMVRTQEHNMSEYAVSTMGCVPRGYVIVNEGAVDYDPDTAFKVGHRRVAIPVKEYAEQRHLTMREQWELMNPQWVGTYFGIAEDLFSRRRPSLEKAIETAMSEDRYDEFISQFWTMDSHQSAIQRLWRSWQTLKDEANRLHDRMMTLEMEISKTESDIHYQRYGKYHLLGYNVHEYLQLLNFQYDDVKLRYDELTQKALKIQEFIEERTFNHRNNGKEKEAAQYQR